MNTSERNEIKQAVSEAVRETGALPREEIRQIVKEAVCEEMARAGINPDDHETAEDMRYVRELRATTDSIKNKTIVAVVGLVVTGVAGVLLLGLKAAFER